MLVNLIMTNRAENREVKRVIVSRIAVDMMSVIGRGNVRTNKTLTAVNG